MEIARTKIETAFEKFPSSEDISNAMWLETKGILLDTGVIESLGGRVKEELKVYSTCLNQYQLPLITCAASLAHHGLLGSVAAYLRLYNVDLTSVPAEHLASLTSSVTERIRIWNVSGCDLVNIMDSVKSEVVIGSQSLCICETKALVQHGPGG